MVDSGTGKETAGIGGRVSRNVNRRKVEGHFNLSITDTPRSRPDRTIPTDMTG